MASPSSASLPPPEDSTIGALIARTGPYPPRGNYSRTTRLKRDAHGGNTCFHVMSRTCGGDVFFDDVEKEALRRLLLRMTSFLGIDLLTYCVMGNHFHALIRVPHLRDWGQQFEGPDGEQRLLRHLGTFYSKAFMQRLRGDIAQWRRTHNEALAQKTLDAFKRRFCDLSVFMMELKVRFTRWFNKRHQRKGTLWMGPFRSVMVEGKGNPLRTMAAYIDLNPVRAGVVKKPEDYRWCGYADALAGSKPAQEGLCTIMQQTSSEWEQAFDEETIGARAAYRRWLYHNARLQINRAGQVSRKGLSLAESEQVTTRERGTLDAGTLLMHTIRHFSQGLAVGSKDWLEGIFQTHRQHFSPKRKTGARKLDAAADIHALRQL